MTQAMSRAHKISNLVAVLLPVPGVRRRDRAALEHAASTGATSPCSRSCTCSPATASRSASTGCSRTARSRPSSRSSTRSPALGSMAVQGPVMTWVADHRKHHAHTDQEGDPHSPHGHGGGLKGAVAGLWYAHMGWLFDRAGQAAPERYARDLYEDRGMRVIQRGFLALRARRLRCCPFALGCAIDGTLAGRADRRAVGRRGADLPAPPRHLVDQLRLPLLRHAAASPSTTTRPTSSGSRCSRSASPGTTTTTRSRARRVHGLRWWELDPTAWIVRAMQRTAAGLERRRDHARAPAPEARAERGQPPFRFVQ